MAVTNFQQLKEFVNSVLTQNNQIGAVAGSPHRAFWSSLSYQQFTTGKLPASIASPDFGCRKLSTVEYYFGLEGVGFVVLTRTLAPSAKCRQMAHHFLLMRKLRRLPAGLTRAARSSRRPGYERGSRCLYPVLGN